ncbi:MAG: flagellar basal body L-ring protein [Ignavibacteriae bacterium 37-53-5]|nr:MAG: flagellar basal body L-ring protein [Ignavibacteriae bacterium 37-53-5]
MKKTFVLALFIAGTSYGQVMQNTTNSLFSDYKAARVGDAVTVLVTEENSASKDASTNTTRQSTIGANGAASYGTANLPSGGVQIGTDNEFKGTGSTSEKGSVQATVSAQVVKVDQYGNLQIQGSRLISINGQDQVIKVSGIIRPSDIQPDNTIYSSQISDARIIFEGSGSINQSQSPGWLTKLFHWLF